MVVIDALFAAEVALAARLIETDEFELVVFFKMRASALEIIGLSHRIMINKY